MNPSCTRTQSAPAPVEPCTRLALALHSRPPGVVSASGGVYKTPAALANPAAAFDPETLVRCADYHAHQTSHHRDGSGWTCDACSEVAP
jgi:hypothetical protein